MRVFQSGIFDPGHASYRLDESLPALSLAIQERRSSSRQAVITTTTLRGLLDPAAFDEPSLLESVEQRIERRHAEAQRPARARLDQLGDRVAMPRPVLEEGEDQELSRALLPLFVISGAVVGR